MHRLLVRQLRRYFGKSDLSLFTPEYRAFFETIDAIYQRCDKSRTTAIDSLVAADTDSLLTAVFDSSTNGLLVVDSDGKIIMHNKRFADMWGIPKSVLDTHDDDKAISHVLNQLRNPDDFTRKVRELYASNESSEDVLEFKDGRAFERYSKPMFIGGTRTGRVWSFHDITERNKKDAEFKANAKETEKMNRLMVGREQRIVELKNELERLKREGNKKC